MRSYSKVLLCKPTYYDLKYSINPWMMDQEVDQEMAHRQFDSLTEAYRQLGITPAFIDQDEKLPDMVFTANAGLNITDDTFIPSNFRYVERQGESQHFADFFASESKKIEWLDKSIVFEGAGDALWCGDTLFLGYGFRSAYNVKDALQQAYPDVKIVSLGLSNPYYYHLDTCFSPLPSGRFVYYPDAFDDRTRTMLAELGGYWVTEEFCVHYGCNMVAINDTVLTSYSDDRIKEIASLEGLDVRTLDIREYIKAGGGVRCLSYLYN